MKTKKGRKDQNVRVTGTGPVTGDQYLKLQQKLGLDLGDFQALLGISMKEHYLLTLNPTAPLADPGLGLHVRLLDEYPELVVPEPGMIELVQILVALMVGRNGPTSSTWSTGRATPARKIMALVRHLLTLLAERDDPDRVLVRYCELIEQEAIARGVADIFKERRWP